VEGLLHRWYHLTGIPIPSVKARETANRNGILVFVYMKGKLMNLNCELHEAAEDIGRLNCQVQP